MRTPLSNFQFPVINSLIMARKEKEEPAGLVDIIKQYVDLKAEYYRLSFVEKVSVLVGKVVLLIFTALLGLALLMLLIMLVYNLLMAWIGIGWVVSLIEIGFILLLMAVVWVFRKPLIIDPVAGSVIRSLMEQDDKGKEDDDEEA